MKLLTREFQNSLDLLSTVYSFSKKLLKLTSKCSSRRSTSDRSVSLTPTALVRRGITHPDFPHLLSPNRLSPSSSHTSKLSSGDPFSPVFIFIFLTNPLVRFSTSLRGMDRNVKGLRSWNLRTTPERKASTPRPLWVVQTDWSGGGFLGQDPGDPSHPTGKDRHRYSSTRLQCLTTTG